MAKAPAYPSCLPYAQREREKGDEADPKKTMTPEVKRMLTERYPEDRATGFQDGDLRGAISVKIVLKPQRLQ